MIVPNDCILNIHFPVGKKFVMVKMAFRRGEDSEDVLRTFFLQEDVPIYMETPILCATHYLLKDQSLLRDEKYTC